MKCVKSHIFVQV